MKVLRSAIGAQRSIILAFVFLRRHIRAPLLRGHLPLFVAFFFYSVVIHFLSWRAFVQVSSILVLCISLAVLATMFSACAWAFSWLFLLSSWKCIFITCLLQPYFMARSREENYVNPYSRAPDLPRNPTSTVQSTIERYNRMVKHQILTNWTLRYYGISLLAHYSRNSLLVMARVQASFVYSCALYLFSRVDHSVWCRHVFLVKTHICYVSAAAPFRG